ncbi:uncharacterized protein NECHADRAFT_93591 [Fusarium vanettenii 77-13-4]|uniref:Uncharacterized protein n=1 Tax=Fusarium vanettenii (strain ATCC MYA-4622 / CBS 123669 / FGSC 9596 / NRRL 45880 / 77-13-4) TaxID=660122 RepID=C7YRI2_FUSV7|nr:uncharacterized protein NECHADRAFT_93591 [Fusarium vanettenii 77-13-4]EEU45081.1 hypothetical protein NECHADRAFT_93591 [Fusarium vanettenii 77-13-4]
MPPTTVTYGKKGLLRSLGSRRRQRYLAEPVNTPRRTSRKRTIGEPQSIEEMASRLLDDSTLPLQARGEDSSPNKRRATTPSVSFPVGSEPAISPLELPSPLEQPPPPAESHTRQLRVGKNSPKRLRDTPRRAATARTPRDALQKRKERSLQRSLGPTRTLSLDPFKFHPTDNLKAPASTPLSTVDGNVRRRLTKDQKNEVVPEGFAEPNSPEDINQKLHAMLAATNALKPSPPRRTNSSASKLTRMVPAKVFAKVSNAWDRLHAKSSPQETGTPGKVSHSGQDNDKSDRLESGLISSPSNMSPISTIEIRLNEGDNLNKRKVQRIVGGQVSRKPVADDGKSLRSGKSLDDPFSEGGGWRTPTSFESRLKKGADNDQSAIPPLPRNPFESEKEFDDNIKDRILKSTPVGSSTPRIRVERISASSSDQSPALQAPKLIQKQTSLRPAGTTLVESVNEARKGWEKAMGTDAFGSKRVKKHPSPSKEALESLEMAFRKYTDLKVSGASIDDLDELATSFMSTSPSLKPYEKKRRSWRRLSISNIDDVAGLPLGKTHRRRGSSPSMMPLTRAQLASENPLKLHRDIRLAPPYRPPGGFSPHDVDELQ